MCGWICDDCLECFCECGCTTDEEYESMTETETDYNSEEEWADGYGGSDADEAALTGIIS